MPSSTAHATESSTSQPSHSTGPASGSSETLPLTDSTSVAQQTSGSAPTQPGKAPVVPTPSTTSSSHVSASSHSQSAAPRSSSPPPSSPSVGPSSAPKPSITSPAGGVLKGSTTPVANAQTPTTTSTVTDHPDTTLTSPVFFSTTNALGRVSLSEPPIFTSIGVTTLSNGELISVTHIVANPTGVWGVNDSNAVSKGFFNNTGAVAGVFLAVGIITAIIGAAACYIISRNRRRRRIRQSISRPMPQLPFPDNPFQDPRDAPSPTQMRYASDSSHRNLVGTGLGVNSSRNRDQPQRNLLDDEFSDESGSSPSATIYTTPPHARELDDNMPGSLRLHNINGTDALGLAGVGANGKSSGKSAYNGPFSDLSTIPVRAPVNVHGRKKSLGGVNIAITTEEKRDSFRVPAPIFHPTPISVSTHPTPVHERRESLQSDRSSPSIYPASELPPVAEDDLPPTPPSPPPSLPAPIMPTPRIPMLRRPLASSVPPVSPQDASAPFSLPPPPRPPKSPPVPPRNPLRASNSLKVKTQVSSYEPLTPPASSISSSSNNDHPSPSTSIEDNRLSNPFSDLAQIHPVDILKPNIGRGDGDGVRPTNIAGVGAGGGARSPSGNVLERPVKAKDTFYTRRKGLELRPSASVEWKN
ncbi:hypothetical protein C8Q75DRAFT_232970 [Abortiporus biennis]|nr:hypothetical protein C8Q75DRAFT_232970 [Abortiporus biennis]